MIKVVSPMEFFHYEQFQFSGKFNFSKNVFNQLCGIVKCYPDATGLVRFVVQDMCSSMMGHEQFLVVGPSNTYKSIEDCNGKWLGDLPSQRYYPENAIEIKDGFMDFPADLMKQATWIEHYTAQ